MKHLNEAELVDFLEMRLEARRLRHAESCETCRARVSGLRSALDAAASVAAPEPSPLLWQHLSARVMDGIAAEDAIDTSRPWWYRLRPQLWAAVAAILLVAGLAAILTVKNSRDSPHQDSAQPPIMAADADSVVDPDDDLDADEGWAIVRAVADDENWGEVEASEAGLTPSPGWVNRAALSLNAAELKELTRILETEMARHKGV